MLLGSVIGVVMSCSSGRRFVPAVSVVVIRRTVAFRMPVAVALYARTRPSGSRDVHGSCPMRHD